MDAKYNNGSQEPLLPNHQVSSNKHIYFNTNIFSNLWLHWVGALIQTSIRKPFEQDMHWDLRKQESSEEISAQLISSFQDSKRSRHPLFRALFYTNKWVFFCAFACCLGSELLQYAVPVLIRYIIDYITDEKRDTKYGLALVFAIIISRFVLIILQTRSNVLFTLLGIKTSNALNGTMFHKALKFSLMRSSEHSQGSIVNNFQVDSQRLYDLGRNISDIIVMPFMIILGIIFMYSAVGISFLGGVAVVTIMSGVNMLINTKYQAIQNKVMDLKDQRMKLTTEMMNGIKYIKMTGWEEIFLKKLDDVREQELKLMRKQNIWFAFTSLTTWLVPAMISSSIFALYILTGHDIDAKTAFTLISTLNIIQQSIRILPMLLSEVAQIRVSLERIKKFLLEDEVKADYIKSSSTESEIAIRVENGNFFWGSKKAHIKKDKSTTEKIACDQNTDAKEVILDNKDVEKTGSVVVYSEMQKK